MYPLVSFLPFLVESKKEKKEKSKKRDSKNLEKDTFGDNNQTEGNDQESPSPKTKKTFGIFRRSGRKSKGTKHGSSDSLKRESRDSVDFDRSGSEFSLEESSGSMGSAATETSEASEKMEKESAKANLQGNFKESNKTGLEGTVLAESSEVVQPDLVEDGGIVNKDAVNEDGNYPSPKEDSNETMKEPDNIQEQNTTPDENTEAQSLELEPQSFVILTEPNEDKDDSSTIRKKEEQNKSVTLTLQDLSRSEEGQESQESARSYEVALEDIKKVHDREITSSEDESVDTVVSTGISDTTDVTREMKEGVGIGIVNEENVEEAIISTYKERKVPPQDDLQDRKMQKEAPMNAEAMLLVYPDKQQVEDQNAQQGNPINEEIPVMLAVSKNQESVIPMLEEDAASGFVEETKHDVSSESAYDNEVHDREMSNSDEFQTLKQADVEESIISTYEKRKVLPQHDSQEPQVREEAPVNEEAILLVYPERQQVHNVNERQDDSIDEEITCSEKMNDDTEEVEIVRLNQEDVEEPIASTYKDGKGPPQDESQDEQVQEEPPLDEEAILLVYPDQKFDQNERQDDAVDEEKLVVETVSTNQENQLQEQVEEFLKFDADIKERSNHESERLVGIVKGEVTEKTESALKETDEKNMTKKGRDIVDDRPEKFASESSPFDEQTSFTSSTPKQSSLDKKRDTTKEIKNKVHKNMKPAKDKSATTGYKTSSMVHEFQVRIQFVNTIKDAKMSSSVLLAQLAEINKRLHELRQELLKLLEKERK